MSCECCGNPIFKSGGKRYKHRPKRFCSNGCRWRWNRWNRKTPKLLKLKARQLSAYLTMRAKRVPF